MKELPAGGRDAHASLLHGLLARLRVLARRRNGDGHSLRETLEELIEEDEEEAQERAEFTEQERGLLRNPSFSVSHVFVTRLLTSAACSAEMARSGLRDRLMLRSMPAVHIWM